MWYYAYCLFPAFRLFPVYQLPLSRPGCFSNGAPLVVILDIRFIPRRIILIFEFYQNFYQKLARHVRSKAPQKIKNQRSPFPRLDKKSPSPRGKKTLESPEKRTPSTPTCPPTPNFRQSSTHQPEPGCYRFFAQSRIVRAPTNVSRHMAESCTFCPSFVRAPSVHGCRLLPPLPSPRPNPR